MSDVVRTQPYVSRSAPATMMIRRLFALKSFARQIPSILCVAIALFASDGSAGRQALQPNSVVAAGATDPASSEHTNPINAETTANIPAWKRITLGNPLRVCLHEIQGIPRWLCSHAIGQNAREIALANQSGASNAVEGAQQLKGKGRSSRPSDGMTLLAKSSA